jgi:hypothetical protein
MSNITIAIEDDVLVKARKLAVEQHTTLTALVRRILKQLAAREDTRTEEVIARLRESFDSTSISIGARTWKREDLHVR